jgi:hypothetical protein
MVRVEDALPSAGIVTGPERLTMTPSGAVPVQAAPRLTVELNPFTDESIIVEDTETPDAKLITVGDG